ncbi:methyltransferase domain-containing protein [Halomonas alimentaria]|uniref:Malonyl-[acyl-carrier protein] O-methyltransferase n=1 Tax=Halomonas alimentaria TaxID=147248 RepID=A0A7X5AQK5_9GAMM|nr:methyltransferase domain-containing protein [Halomonas alimentaria]NAW35569.1 methyltransferase domain-containing protein [Halomonas alimentaria]
MNTPALPHAATSDDWQRRVAHAFSRAADNYERLATAQQAMGETLWARLPPRAASVLDLGCGPGQWSQRLAEHFAPDARIVGLDLARGMLEVARRDHDDRVQWVCGNATALPLADGRLELVFSNLALQWCPDLDAVMAELHRVLRPGGQALINTLGPGTLAEVSHAWQRPGHPAALLDFRQRERYLEAAHLAGFRRVAVAASRPRFHYVDLAAVMASIKGIGAQVSRPAGHLTRADLARARRRYESLREPTGLPVTYHLLTLELVR